MLYYKEDYVYFSKNKKIKNKIFKRLQFAFRIFQVKNIKNYQSIEEKKIKFCHF